MSQPIIPNDLDTSLVCCGSGGYDRCEGADVEKRFIQQDGECFCFCAKNEQGTLSNSTLAANTGSFGHLGLHILWPGPAETRGSWATDANEKRYREACQTFSSDVKYSYAPHNYLTDPRYSTTRPCE